MLSVDPSNLTARLSECLKHLQKLEDCYMVEEKFSSEFKDLLSTLNAYFTQLSRSTKLVLGVSSKNKIFLCLSQISKSLKLFAHLLCKPLYRQGVWYVCERLRWCVTELRSVCRASDTAEDSDSDSDWFLRRVDEALQLLEAQGSAVFVDPSWTKLINDIICQAVTIAKVATVLDYNEITSACHGILEINSQLMNEGSLNSNQLSHLSHTMFNNLVSLEERVNVAILRLVLQVFSEPCRPVKLLVRQCGQAPPTRSLCDLDPLVADLDAHIEHVMLIGQFAVSCCDDAARVRGIRCCLASIESIDNYLVPALKALYLTPACEDKRRFAQLLCDHWQAEIQTLHSDLDNIIDSTAFTRVVQESVNDLIRQLCKEGAKEEVTTAIVKQSWLLYKHLSASGSLLDLIQLKQSVCEYEAASKQKAHLAALEKRARRIMSVIDKIADSQNSIQQSFQQPSTKTSSESSHMVKSLRDLPLDISLSTSKSQCASYKPPWLQRKIDELKEKVSIESNEPKFKDEMERFAVRANPIENCVTPDNKPGRSNCETPKTELKAEGDLLTPFLKRTTDRNATLYKRTPRRVVQTQLMDDASVSPAVDCSWSVSGPNSCSDSLVLDISEILDNLSMLADTLSSNKAEANNSWQQPQPTPAADVMKKYFSGSSFDSQWFSQTSVRTDEVSADVDTPERIQDLQRVDEKIRSLKLS